MEGEQHLDCRFIHSTSRTVIPLGGLLWEVGLFICFRGGSCRGLGAEFSSRSCSSKERSPQAPCPPPPGLGQSIKVQLEVKMLGSMGSIY